MVLHCAAITLQFTAADELNHLVCRECIIEPITTGINRIGTVVLTTWQHGNKNEKRMAPDRITAMSRGS